MNQEGINYTQNATPAKNVNFVQNATPGAKQGCSNPTACKPNSEGSCKRPYVCIVGCSDSKDLAPFTSSSYEFWGVNNLYHSLPPDKVRWDRWFEIHEISFDGSNYKRRGDYQFRGQKVNDYLKGLSRLPCPVYMQQKWAVIPNSIIYPIDKIKKNYGTYFTNTISYMLALAIDEGFEKIAVYGVDMAVGSEYSYQRSSCEEMIGIAKGKGIEIEIPDEADLLKTRFMYAFDEKNETAWNKKIRLQRKSLLRRRNEALMKLDQLQKEIEATKSQVNQYNGGIHTIDEQVKIWENCSEKGECI